MNNKKLSIIISLVVVMFLTSLFLWNGKEKAVNNEDSESNSPFIEATSGVASVTNGTAEQTKTYTQLVSEYVDRRIQFDAMCQAIPKNITYKNGTKVMFDNRSGDARYISVGGVLYYFPGYGYKVLTLSSSKLPKTLYLNCGAGVNVGLILLQR